MTFVLLAVVLFVIGAAIAFTPLPWRDDGDVRGIVLHTVRIPSALERHAIWRGRNFLREDAGEKVWPAKIVLPKSLLLMYYPRSRSIIAALEAAKLPGYER